MSASKILVPIDFYEQSMVALGQAVNLAKIKKSAIVLLSVIKEQSIMQTLFLDDTSDELKVISAYLIVMETNGSQGRSSKIIGSNAERVVRLSKCPVITIKGKDHRNGCENIILPIDLEKETKQKVTYALEYARYWNATIRVVSVVLRDNQAVRTKLIKNINQVKNFIIKAGVKCTAELVEGEKKQTLGDFVFEYGKRFDADLIMIMTKNEESFSNTISDTARYIINNSEVPIMSIRPKESRFITGPTTAF